jgi:2-haloacid dehalogenase
MKEDIEIISFDCYGSLVDWKKGILDILVPLFDEYLLEITEDEIFSLFLKFYDEQTQNGFIYYRNVLMEIMKKFSKALNINLMRTDLSCLIDSLPNWPLFTDTRDSLKQLKNSFELALIVNSDNDLIEKTISMMGIKFDYIITSEAAHSYKPSPAIFLHALKVFPHPSHKIIHVAQSLQFDIAACNEIGIENIWLNRYNDKSPEDQIEKPGKEISSLEALTNLL